MAKADFRNRGETYDERLQNAFTAYVNRIARNEQKRCQFLHDRQKKRLLTREENDLYEDDRLPARNLQVQPERDLRPATWHDVLQNLDSQRLYRVLKRLSDEEANILFLHIVLDLRYADIERVTGLTACRAQHIYTMTIRKIRRALEREGKNAV